MTAGLRKVCGGTGHCASKGSSSFLLVRTKRQMWQVWATWWKGIHRSCRAGPAHTNIPGTAKGVCLLHPAQTPGEASQNRERAGQRCNVLPLQPLPACTTTMGRSRIPQQGSTFSTWFCALNCPLPKPHSLRRSQACSWGHGGSLLPDP